MNGFYLMRTATTPEIAFEPEGGTLSFVGECYPENPQRVFAPVHAALAAYLDAGGHPDTLDVVLRLTYVNSSSTKVLRRLFVMLAERAGAGARLRVTWMHEPDDDAIVELGQDLAFELDDLPFTMAPIDVRAVG
jgi:hypothetical protein